MVATSRRVRARGASLPEYALVLAAIILVAAGAYRSLGSRVGASADRASAVLVGGNGAAGGAAIAGDGAGRGGVGGFFRDFARGFVLGDYAEGSSAGQIVGQIVGGLVPFYGQAADIRDATAAMRDIANGTSGGWTNLGLAAVGFVPGVGDAAKGIIRGARHADEAALAVGAVRRARDTTDTVAAIARRGDDGVDRIPVQSSKNMDGVRRVTEIPVDQPVYRVQPNDLPLDPHKSPFFDPMEYNLPPGKRYEAIYVSPDKGGLESLRQKQGYFEQGDVMHTSTLGEVVNNANKGTSPDKVWVFSDGKLEWSTGTPGYVIVREVP
ncbi:MAG: hypothetical protein KF819_29675 [Labilithrix sp.]|nr:hypothetical protein [Labilithrix sp.]